MASDMGLELFENGPVFLAFQHDDQDEPITQNYYPAIDQNYTCSVADTPQFVSLFGQLYNTLRKRQTLTNQGPVDFIYCNFLESTEDKIKEFSEMSYPGATNLKCHPIDLLRLLCCLTNSNINISRGVLELLVPKMVDNQVNEIAVRVFKQQDDITEGAHYSAETLTFTCLLRYFSKLKSILRYTGNRVRWYMDAISRYKVCVFNLPRAEQSLNDLHMGLCTKTETYTFIQELSIIKRDLLTNLDKVITQYNLRKQNDVKLLLTGVTQLDSIKMSVLSDLQNAAPQGSRLWYCYHKLTQNVSLETYPELKQVFDRIAPLVSGIRGFASSSRDLAIDKKKHMKPICTELNRKILQFENQPETRNIPTGKQLLADITTMKNEFMKIRLEGVSVPAGEMDLDQDTLELAYNQVSGFITESEADAKLKMETARIRQTEISKSTPVLHLKPLRNSSDWLSFISSVNSVFALHQSELVKQELLNRALQDKTDKVLTKDLDLKQTMSYLYSKYSSDASIPRLLQELMSMKTPHTQQASYNNLTKFISISQQLTSFQSIDKLDSYIRSKLINLLLTPQSQQDFYKDKLDKEAGWKREMEIDISLTSDHDAMSIHCKDPSQDYELEEKKRTFFLDKMKMYLVLTRTMLQYSAINETGSKGEKSKNSRSSSTAHSLRGDSAAGKSTNCVLCNQVHLNKAGQSRDSVYFCPKFNKLSVSDRIKTCTQKFICKRCLCSKKENHQDKGCPRSDKSNAKCSACEPGSGVALTHHTLLHLPKNGQAPPQPSFGKKNAQQSRNNKTGKKKTVSFLASASNSKNPATGANKTPIGDNSSHFASYIAPVQNFSSNADGIHKKDMSIDNSRIFLSCVTNVTAHVPGQAKVNLTVVLDTGSGLGWLSHAAQEKLKATANSTSWRGSILTALEKKSDSVISTYTIILTDVFGIEHQVCLLGTKDIGFRPSLPSATHSDICHELGADPQFVSNIDSPINAILGLDCIHLLAERCAEFTRIPKNPMYSGVRLFRSVLSHFPFLSGALGDDLVTKPCNNTLTYYTKLEEQQQA